MESIWLTRLQNGVLSFRLINTLQRSVLRGLHLWLSNPEQFLLLLLRSFLSRPSRVTRNQWPGWQRVTRALSRSTILTVSLIVRNNGIPGST